MRGTLEGVVSEQQGEIIRLTNDLGHTKDERDKSLREAQQARNLWESEVFVCVCVSYAVMMQNSA